MQSVVHVAHHVEPSVIQLGYHTLFTVAGLIGLSLLLNLVLRCCGKK